MERPTSDVLITSKMIFMMEFPWNMIVGMDTKHGKSSL